MRRNFVSLRGMTALSAASLFLGLCAVTPAPGHGGGHGGGGHAAGHAGAYSGAIHSHGLGGFYGHGYPGLYHRGLYGPGFYRPNYGYGLGYGLGGFGLGYGLGLGLGGFGYGGYGLGGYGLGGYGLGGYGLGGYGMGGYGLGGYGMGGYGMGGGGGYAPYYGGYGYPIAAAPPPGGQTPPRPDNAAHLQLIVPEQAEVRIDGYKTNQTGSVREFFSPALTAGTNYTYKISVRYTNAAGKEIDDSRAIYVRANDWFRIDFTKPPPPEPLPPQSR